MRIEVPTNCPSCNSPVIWVGDQIFCHNSSCDSKVEKVIEHFAKTLKIKGLGPSTISKLELDSINQIYSLSRDYMLSKLGSVKIVDKLISEIESSKSADLETLLAAFSIPLIGTTAAKKIGQICSDISSITTDNLQAAGIGPKASDNLLSWLEISFPYYKELPFSFKFEPKKTPNKNKGVVCISGKLKSFKTKAEATLALENAGYLVKSDLTKDVTILINESGIESAKTQKARQSGVQIILDIKEIL